MPLNGRAGARAAPDHQKPFRRPGPFQRLLIQPRRMAVASAPTAMKSFAAPTAQTPDTRGALDDIVRPALATPASAYPSPLGASSCQDDRVAFRQHRPSPYGAPPPAA